MNPTVKLSLASLALAAATLGCHSDRPHDVGQERPSVSDLDSRDRGLQSKDVVDASDQVVQYLLRLPDFNGPTRKTVVVTSIENHTSNANFNYDIFIQRLKANVGMYGRDRLMILGNRDRVNDLRNKELDPGAAPAGNDFGQGDGGRSQPAPAGGPLQPQFALSAVVTDLPNRGTNYYLFNFSMINLATREEIPLQPFEVRVAR
jgi:hypothetical protein